MRNLNPLLLLIVLFLFEACSESEEINPIEVKEEINANTNEPLDVESSDSIIEGYKSLQITGYNVHVQLTAYRKDTLLTEEVISMVTASLLEIDTIGIPSNILNEVKKTPIFIDWETTNGLAVYHPSLSWLQTNGYIAEKTRSIEISNIKNFKYWVQKNQPYIILHELTHAYHHRVLNDTQIDITNAYNNALAQNLYVDIPYDNGNGDIYDVSSAYALTNEFEFFAELTEAYFGKNDYYPFNRDDLKRYDEEGYEAIIKAWNLE